MCWVSTATFSSRDRRWHSVFHVIAYSLHEVNITLSYEVCQADMGCYCEEFINRMLLTYRWQQCADRQSLATNFKANLPWFDKVFFWASFREESRQHKRGKQCGGNLQREHQKKKPQKQVSHYLCLSWAVVLWQLHTPLHSSNFSAYRKVAFVLQSQLLAFMSKDLQPCLWGSHMASA